MKLLTYKELEKALSKDYALVRRISIWNPNKTRSDYYSNMLPFASQRQGQLCFHKTIKGPQYVWDRMSEYLFTLEKFKVLKGRCPHCNEQLIETQTKGYYGQCLKCDEDFYKIESI